MRSPKSPGDGNDREKRVCHRREGSAVLRGGDPCINHTSPCLSLPRKDSGGRFASAAAFFTYSSFRLAVQLLLQPVLTVHIAGHDERYHIVACGIDHGGGRIHQIADSQRDGVRDGQLVREEDGANHQFAGTASARDLPHRSCPVRLFTLQPVITGKIKTENSCQSRGNGRTHRKFYPMFSAVCCKDETNSCSFYKGWLNPG